MTRRSRRRPLLAAASLIALVGVLASGATGALAHAEPVAVIPADGAKVASPPTEIVITFTESLDPGRSSIRLVDAGGTIVAEGGRVDPGDDVNTMRLPLATSLGPGGYTVHWTSFSTEDNEQARGTTTFTVASASAPPSTGPGTSAADPSAGGAASEAASPSAPPAASGASSADVLVPIIAVLILMAVLGTRLLRGRSRGPG